MRRTGTEIVFCEYYWILEFCRFWNERQETAALALIGLRSYMINVI